MSYPTGLWIVTDDGIKASHDLLMRLFVDGESRQSESTSAAMTPQVFLEVGDVVRAEIDRVAEPVEQ